ncbi:MAG: FHA domain-containing protein [Phycisphaeraceae bacterium]|nr:FHA domain-containing protein [Phycisphaeraceae bacterium]
MKVTLVMFKADGTRRDFPLNKPRVVIGRKNTCDLRIPLHSVSRQHCELLIDDDALRLRDLGSSNGTFHNSKRIQEALLQAGDQLTVGPVIFIVVIDGQPEQILPVRTVIEDSDDTGSLESPPADEPAKAADEDQDEDENEDEDEQSADDSRSGSSAPLKMEAAGSGIIDLDDPIAALAALADEEEDRDKDDQAQDSGEVGEFEFLTDDDQDKQ